jgi:ribosome-associated translation inhibitor RaiA
METQIFHHAKNTPNLQKKSSKRIQKPSRYYNSITNLKVSTQAKTSYFKNPHIKIDLLARGQTPLSYYTL